LNQTSVLTNEQKKSLGDKLKRIEGRVKGLVKMIEDDRPNRDIMMQVLATIESLRLVNRALIQDSLEDYVSTSLNSLNKEKKEASYQEFMDLIYKYVK
jgi:CsoR family transcriptional regulator, copper-sensing transcriptional repressor